MKIAPDDQFAPSAEKVAKILSRYGLEFLDYEAASSGIENTTLLVSAASGKFVARIYRQDKKQLDAIHLELDFMRYLSQHDIPIPRVITNRDNEQITTVYFDEKKWQVIVMEFIGGEHAKTYSPKLVIELSAIQARMHILSASWQGNVATSEQLAVLKETYFITQIPMETIQDERLAAFLRRAENYTVELPADLPVGLCHLDYDANNVLTQDDVVTAVLDFDDVAIAPFVVCLAYTLRDVYMVGGQQTEDSYRSHYETLRSVSNLEREYIKPIMLFRHYMISAINVLNGNTSSHEIDQYLYAEAYLQ